MNSSKVLYSPGKNDECYTPAYAVRAILPYLDRRLTYWLPFDTEESEFVKVFREMKMNFVSSHISTGQDFYAYEPDCHWDAMVSNPPFSNKRKIFERALSFGKPFGLLMSLTWLNDAAPKQVFRHKPLQLLMFKERIRFLGMGDKITFSSAYFCHKLLFAGIVMDSLREHGYTRRSA